MSFLSNLFGSNNNYTAQSAAGPGSQITKQDLTQALQNAQNNYNSVNSNQNALIQALQQQMQGQGPNLANAQLKAATDRNIAQGSGLIASQKGVSPALASRLIAQQTAGANQAAAQQSAINKMQQQYTATGQLGNVLAQQGELANQNYNINQGAVGAQNNAIVGATNAANQVNASIAQSNANTNGQIAGGLLNGVGAVLGLADGGEVPDSTAGPSSNVGKFLSGMSNTMSNSSSPMMPGLINLNMSGDSSGFDMGKSIGKDLAGIGKSIFKPNMVESTVGPLGSSDVKSSLPVAQMASKGMLVPGKATVPGDSVVNDQIPAMLSPKEIVLPRSVTMAPDAPQRAAQFVAEIQAKRYKRSK